MSEANPGNQSFGPSRYVEVDRAEYEAMKAELAAARAPVGDAEVEEVIAELLFFKTVRSKRLARVVGRLARERDEASDKALEQAARACESRLQERQDEFGSVEPDTNAFNYPRRSEDMLHSLDEEDDNCAAAIRALKSKGGA